MKYKNFLIIGIVCLVLMTSMASAAPTLNAESYTNTTYTKDVYLNCLDTTEGIGRIELYSNASGSFEIIDKYYASGPLSTTLTSAVDLGTNFTTTNIVLTSNDLPLDRTQGVAPLLIPSSFWGDTYQGYYYQQGAGDWVQYEFL